MAYNSSYHMRLRPDIAQRASNGATTAIFLAKAINTSGNPSKANGIHYNFSFTGTRSAAATAAGGSPFTPTGLTGEFRSLQQLYKTSTTSGIFFWNANYVQSASQRAGYFGFTSYAYFTVSIANLNESNPNRDGYPFRVPGPGVRSQLGTVLSTDTLLKPGQINAAHVRIRRFGTTLVGASGAYGTANYNGNYEYKGFNGSHEIFNFRRTIAEGAYPTGVTIHTSPKSRMYKIRYSTEEKPQPIAGPYYNTEGIYGSVKDEAHELSFRKWLNVSQVRLNPRVPNPNIPAGETYGGVPGSYISGPDRHNRGDSVIVSLGRQRTLKMSDFYGSSNLAYFHPDEVSATTSPRPGPVDDAGVVATVFDPTDDTDTHDINRGFPEGVSGVWDAEYGHYKLTFANKDSYGSAGYKAWAIVNGLENP